MVTIRKSGILAALLAGLTFALLLAAQAGAATAKAQPQGVACLGAFEGHVLRGPQADLSLVGNLALTVQSGKVTGALVRKDERTAKSMKVADVSGTVKGGKVSISFTTSSGKRVAGTGKLSTACKGTLRGNLEAAGGNRGVWELRIRADSFEHICPVEIDEDGEEIGKLENSRVDFEGGYYFDCNTNEFVI
jgi:hypothetical protein